MNELLNGLTRTVVVNETTGPQANGFPAELLADLEEGRRRRLARQKEFDAFVRADLGAAFPYAAVPLLVAERDSQAEVSVRLAGMAEIRRRYQRYSDGWIIGPMAFETGTWAVLPFPHAPEGAWHYVGEWPEALAVADALGEGYHQYQPPPDRPPPPSLEDRAVGLLRDLMDRVHYGTSAPLD